MILQIYETIAPIMDEVCDFIVKNVDADESNEISEYVMQSYNDSIENSNITSYITSTVNYIIDEVNIHLGEQVKYISTSDGDVKAFVAFFYKNRKCIVEDYYSSRGYSYWYVRMLPVCN